MSDTIKGSIIGAVITGIISLLIFFLGNFSTQDAIEKNTVETLSRYFDSVDKDMSYEQTLQTIYKENVTLKSEISRLEEHNQNLAMANEEAMETIEQKYDVDFQNINLIINGIDSGYHDKAIIVNNETFYSQGFIQYIVDNHAISFENTKLFVGSVQAEDQMPIPLFELDPFTEGYSLSKTTNEKDNYGNVFPEAFRVRSADWGYEDLMNNATEYFIDYNYTTLCFDYAYSKNASQGLEYEILIYGDGNLLRSVILNRKTKVDSVEVDVSNVEFLQIVGKSEAHWELDGCYSLIINPYLYP